MEKLQSTDEKGKAESERGTEEKKIAKKNDK